MERIVLACSAEVSMRPRIIFETSLLCDFRGAAFQSSLRMGFFERKDWFFCDQSMGRSQMLSDGRMGRMGRFAQGSSALTRMPSSRVGLPRSRASMSGAC